MKQLFGNNASALLAATITDSDLTIQVATGFGAAFPAPGADEFFLVTLENAAGDIEVVKITGRSTDLLTVPASGRGQEGTSAAAWTGGQARVELRLTEGTMETFIQRGGDTMEGDLDMDTNDLRDAVLVGTGTKMTAGEIVNVPLRGVSADSSNEIRVPTDGTRATAGNKKIVVQDDTTLFKSLAYTVGQIILWFGSSGSVPSGWHICNGDAGTPDLRDKFVIGAGMTYALSDSGGAASIAAGVTGADGGHDHTGVTGDTVLDEAQIPVHNHRLYVKTATDTDNENVGFGAARARAVAATDDNAAGPYGYAETNISGTKLIEDAGGGDGSGHHHSIPTESDHTHTIPAIPTLPPFKALYYIMFVGA